jgi:hypothetical protein
MKQSNSWEANRSSARQKIPRNLRNPEPHDRIYNFRPHVQILSQSIQSTEPSKNDKGYFLISVTRWLYVLSDASSPTGRSGVRIPLEARFSASLQTGPGAHPTSCTMRTGSFLGVKREGRAVDHPPPSSAEVEGRVRLYIYSPSGPLVAIPFHLWHTHNRHVDMAENYKLRQCNSCSVMVLMSSCIDTHE